MLPIVNMSTDFFVIYVLKISQLLFLGSELLRVVLAGIVWEAGDEEAGGELMVWT